MAILFANREWSVRDEGYLAKGPGPNYWSKENVWLDDSGKLHLAVRWNPLYACWECAQVKLTDSLGYGTYRWKVEGFPSRMDEQLILGLYTYDQFAIDADYREIDIEIGKWGDPDNQNSQYVIRPSNPNGGYKSRFNTTQTGSYMMYEYTWQPGFLHFKTWHGHDSTKKPFHEWTFEGDFVPQPGNETTQMNLWLFRGESPRQNHEVIIKDFHFIK
ncbi:hypothetical protein [Gracilibacillus sp. YIM 98692]|uniref:hypothetical protein n=1 Tax=Gracilibacillus sp. YIM 98692 TaxID=2663532 RepID=UPI0013D2DA95|nr:hypothetical protein [Gracilibacillus sp. YIM 98692]